MYNEFIHEDISNLYLRKCWDKIRYEEFMKKEKDTKEIIEDLKDNEFIIKDSQGIPIERFWIRGNKFYHQYNEFNNGENLDIDNFVEYEYKIEGDKIYVRELYHYEHYFCTSKDGGTGYTIKYRVDGGVEVRESRSAWGHTTEKHRFHKDDKKGGWINWRKGYSSKVRETVLNYAKGKIDLDYKVEKKMLISKNEAEEIAREYLGDIDDVEVHFSQLYDNKEYKEYSYYLFHRKNAFKFNKKYVAIVSKKEKQPYESDVIKVLQFESNYLKEIFNKKKKKDGEKSDFIRIRFIGNTASFETGNGNVIDISSNLIKK